MSRHFNRVYLIGNLTRDPELRYTPNNTAVAEFGLAVNRNYQDSNGEWQEEVTFVDITVWGNTAENCSNYIEKGSRIFLEGRLDFNSWETDSGKNRSELKVTAQRVIFLDSVDSDGPADPEEVMDDLDGTHTEDDVPF